MTPSDEAPQPPLHHDRDARGGRYWMAFGDEEAEMTYRLINGAMVIDHTFSPPKARGTGVAARMVKQAVEDARAEGLKIRPVCSYAVAQFQRHPEWSDLLPS